MQWNSILATKKALAQQGLFRTPGGIRTHGLPLRSNSERPNHSVLRCFADFLKPLHFKGFSHLLVLLDIARFCPIWLQFPVSC